ncbi:MAG: hypothetical protein Q8P15_02205 [Nanoarchaeota archaeon]|nr:hypothetical protein [Nanoarchaeota archaeon]
MININKIVFGNEEEFINFINQHNTLSREQKREFVEHEKAHYDKALELGFNPVYGWSQYGIKLPFVNKYLSYKMAHVTIKITSEKIPCIKKIVDAPKNPSFLDKLYSKLF